MTSALAPSPGVVRDDLPWLRRRTLNPTRGTPAPAPSNAPAASSPLADFVNGRAARPGRASTSAPSITQLTTELTTELTTQLTTEHTASQPAPPSRTAPAATPQATQLTTQTAQPATQQPTASGTSLTLSTAPASLESNTAAEVGPRAARRLDGGYIPTRVRPGTPLTLTGKAPTVTLTAVQSGVGALTFQAACANSDVRLGAAYQLRSGASGILQPAGGPSQGPVQSAQPVLRHTRDRFDTITVDLRQAVELERLVLLAYSAAGDPTTTTLSGTLVTTTYGGARVEAPISPQAGTAPAGHGGVVVALSLYNVDGQYVLRAENDTIPGTFKDACLAYGFERITWLDDRTPLT